MRNVLSLAASAVVVAACGSGSMNQDAGRDVQRPLNNIDLSPSFAFEGQRRYVGSIGPSRGDDDLSMATLSTDVGSPIVIDSYQCNRIRCGFVAHIEDTTANRGTAVPEPTSGVTFRITVVGAQLSYAANLQVFPLDTADAAAFGNGQISSDAVYSSLVINAGSTLRARPDRPVRFAVMNQAAIHGTFDFSASGMSAGPGGHNGGMPPGGDGQGPLPGLGAMSAGGGGGNAEPGGAGGAMGGAGGAAVTDPLLAQLAGGSGGGASATGAGGGGGGALSLMALGSADFGGAQFLFRGAAGVMGGGGGAGGMFVLGGAPTGTFTVDVSAGAGGSGTAMGGAGGAGRVRVDGDVSVVPVTGGRASQGLRYDVAGIPPLVRDAVVPLRGTAAPNTRVRVQNEINRTVTGMQETTSGADGAWSMDFPLIPGAASLIAYSVAGTTATPSTSGTTVVVRGAAGAREVYSGALDVVYVPQTE